MMKTYQYFSSLTLVLLPVLAFCLLFSSCKKRQDEENKEEEQAMVQPTPGAGTTHGRVVLVYMAAENTLATYAASDINEILTGAKFLGANDHVILYLDNTDLPRIYDITYRQQGKRFSELTPVVQFDTDHDSCTPEVFSQVLSYTVQNYPSASYGLVLWSHGSGWIPPRASVSASSTQAWGSKQRASLRRAFGFDNQINDSGSNGGSQLSINQLRDVLSQYSPLDFILFDACFMQNIETLYQLRQCVRYIIASPAEFPAFGAPYDTMLQPMFQDADYISGMVQAYYDCYKSDAFYGVLLSAVQCDRLEALAEQTRPYVQQYKQKLLNMDYTGILDYFWWDTFPLNLYYYPDFYDMQGVMRAALSDEDYQQWQSLYQQIFVSQAHTPYWYSAFNNLATNAVDEEQYSGISMHVPLQKYVSFNNAPFSKAAPAYYETDWAKAVWN